jgi:hypothetical protein
MLEQRCVFGSYRPASRGAGKDVLQATHIVFQLEPSPCPQTEAVERLMDSAIVGSYKIHLRGNALNMELYVSQRPA